MAIDLLAALLGIGAVVGLTVVLGGSRPARLSRVEAALDLMRRDHDGFPCRDAELTVDGSAALLRSEAGTVGLVFAMGGNFVTRLLVPGDVRAASVEAGSLLRVTLTDFGAPRLSIPLASEATAATWCNRLEELIATPRDGGV